MGNVLCHTIPQRCRQAQPVTNEDAPIELISRTGTQFMDLNDDCIRMILNMVNLMDLCSLLELSKIDSYYIRLKTITGELFSRKYNFCHLNEDVKTYVEAQRLLTHFGPLISHISFQHLHYTTLDGDHRIFKAIIQNCSGTLKSLRVYRYTFEANKAKPVFPNLRKLDLYACRFKNNASHLFARCNSLIELSVSYDYSYAAPSDDHIFRHTFPELELFTGGVSSNNFKKFIVRHQKLKAINLLSDCDPVPILPLIADNCTDLKKLTIPSDGDNDFVEYEMAVKNISRLMCLEDVTIIGYLRINTLIRQLSQLPLLKELRLESDNLCSTSLSLLSQLKMLEKLEIYAIYGYIDFNPIADLCSLRKLSIYKRGNLDIDLIHILSRLTDLEKLKIYVSHEKATVAIDKKMLARIVDIRSRCTRPILEINCNQGCFRFTLTDSGVAVDERPLLQLSSEKYYFLN